MINVLQHDANVSRLGREFTFGCGGLQPVMKVDANGVVLKRYVRGQDLTGSADGAGGVGSLLAMMQGSRSDHVGYYFADANGNITRMYGANDQELANYRYNPFGNITNATGSWVTQNRYQWSSKENDAVTGLVYYLYRFYSPELGRWVNRDPIGERGGVNLYGYVTNNSCNRFDPLGYESFDNNNGIKIKKRDLDVRRRNYKSPMDQEECTKFCTDWCAVIRQSLKAQNLI